jgi:hypothetical protein
VFPEPDKGLNGGVGGGGRSLPSLKTRCLLSGYPLVLRLNMELRVGGRQGGEEGWRARPALESGLEKENWMSCAGLGDAGNRLPNRWVQRTAGSPRWPMALCSGKGAPWNPQRHGAGEPCLLPGRRGTATVRCRTQGRFLRSEGRLWLAASFGSAPANLQDSVGRKVAFPLDFAHPMVTGRRDYPEILAQEWSWKLRLSLFPHPHFPRPERPRTCAYVKE